MLKITNFLNINNALVSYSLSRLFSTTSINNNMKNFNKFTLIWRGTEYEKKKLKEYPARLEVERGLCLINYLVYIFFINKMRGNSILKFHFKLYF